MRNRPSHLRQAHGYRDAGDKLAAEQAYKQAIAGGDREAYHWLARLLVESGRYEEALREADLGAEAQPRNGLCLEARGLALKGLNRLDEAAAAYAAAIAQGAATFGMHYNLGNVYRAAGRLTEAAASYRYAIRLDAGQPWAWNNLGDTYRALEAPEEAAHAYQAAARLMPHTPEFLFNLGRVQVDCHRPAEAAANLAEVVAMRPDDSAAHQILGDALRDLDDLAGAAASYTEAARLRPDEPGAATEIGSALCKIGQFGEAERLLREAILLAPDVADTHCNLASALSDMGRYAEAGVCLETALRLDPEHAMAHYVRSTMRLTEGRLPEGFAEYEWRWQAWKRTPLFDGPTWTGEPAPGKTLVVYPDQGAGDFIQFSRFAAPAAGRVKALTLMVTRAQGRLFQGLSVPGVTVVVGDGPDDAEPHDLHCPASDLPHALGADLGTIPPPLPITADPVLEAKWRARLAALPGRKIGLVWAGNPDYPDDRARSVRFAALAPLLGKPDVSFISLQKGGAPWTRRPADAASRANWIDWTDELTDFAETAALIAALDLTISVDTSVAHLAGTLGKPVWLLNRFDTDWRWMRGRDDTPWYPSMRIFRQSAPRDWHTVVGTVCAALAG
jgi:tetratricopeptide (TPR) repeat protein